MYYVYVLVEERSGENYVGYSANLKSRITQHQEGRGAKTTRNGTWHLVYYEAYVDKRDAVIRERRLKQNGNARRQLLKRVEESVGWAKSGAGEARNRSPNKRRP